jgi:hypothetical protein
MCFRHRPVTMQGEPANDEEVTYTVSELPRADRAYELVGLTVSVIAAVVLVVLLIVQRKADRDAKNR